MPPVLHLTKQLLGKDSKPSPQTIYQDDILTQSAYLCITTPKFEVFETNQSLHKEKNEPDSEEGFGETSEDTNVVNNPQRQDQRIEYDDRSYLRIHSVGKDRKRVHIISVANDDVHAYPMSQRRLKILCWTTYASRTRTQAHL